MNILISVLNGRMKGRKFPVAEGKTCKIGRGSGADIVIVDSMSSRLHCEVSNNGNAFILKDLGSSNGTYKDNETIKQVNVYSGDRFKIGSTVFEIRGLEGPIEEAPPGLIPMGFEPVPQDFQVHDSSPIEELEEVPDLEEAEEEEEKPAGDRMTVEFRKTVESTEEGEEESSLAILEPVPGFDYEDELLCIRCGEQMVQKDIDRGLAQKEGRGFVCPKCVRAEIDGQMSDLGFGNIEVVDVDTIDDELLEEMKKEGTDVAESLDEALRSQKDK
jgi:pSer/pThr/pTyr-binding forkhead associated (FHA) protein